MIVREDSNRRGRADGEIAAMLKAAAVEAGLSEEKVRIVLDEFEAVRAGVERTNKDELVVLMIDKPAKVWDELENIAGRRPA